MSLHQLSLYSLGYVGQEPCQARLKPLEFGHSIINAAYPVFIFYEHLHMPPIRFNAVNCRSKFVGSTLIGT